MFWEEHTELPFCRRTVRSFADLASKQPQSSHLKNPLADRRGRICYFLNKKKTSLEKKHFVIIYIKFWQKRTFEFRALSIDT